jgi:WD40 repeat protein
VSSKQFQFFGAVSSQLHARGVHTDLLMHVEVSQDGLYCFAGVTRGSMELHAVFLGHLLKRQPHQDQNVLDFLRVHVHSDAKIKGFGACTRVMPKKGDPLSLRPKYLLLTGKGIKNIHIWSFEPPVYDATGHRELEPARWENLYDHATNGNTISLLSFAYLPLSNTLMAISKSDKQKIRLWDLSSEQEHSMQHGVAKRPKRPHYKDVFNSENAIAVAGNDFCVCGGNGMYNQMSMVSLEQPESMFNHTELALPVVGDTEACNISSVTTQSLTSRRRRPQRGDLKQVIRAATMVNDASHVLLELDDVSIV